jgi:NADH dehydrogenase
MRILVTGGTGFVGMRIVGEAVDAGHEVVSLSRGVQSAGHPYPISNVKIDLVRPEGLDDALRGVGTVVHAAGILREQSGQDYERAHVGATENLVAACHEAGIGKIVHLSALGARANASTPYLRTKWQAEQVVEESGIPYTILRPSLIFGAGDRFVSHLLTLVRFSPLVPVLGPEQAVVQPVWVGDVATAIVRAADDESTSGNTYELGGPASMSFNDMIERLKEASSRPVLSVHLPGFLSTSFVKLGEMLFDDPPLTIEQLGALALGGACDPNPAAVTFGLRMRSLEDVLPEYRSSE